MGRRKMADSIGCKLWWFWRSSDPTMRSIIEKSGPEAAVSNRGDSFARIAI
jgi:hypothetical protein